MSSNVERGFLCCYSAAFVVYRLGFVLVKAPVLAQFAVDPYTVQVPNQEDEQKTIALALEQALMRATGSTSILELPQTEKLKEEPKRLSLVCVARALRVSFSSHRSLWKTLSARKIRPFGSACAPILACGFWLKQIISLIFCVKGMASPWSEFSMDASQDFGLPLELPNLSC